MRRIPIAMLRGLLCCACALAKAGYESCSAMPGFCVAACERSTVRQPDCSCDCPPGQFQVADNQLGTFGGQAPGKCRGGRKKRAPPIWSELTCHADLGGSRCHLRRLTSNFGALCQTVPLVPTPVLLPALGGRLRPNFGATASSDLGRFSSVPILRVDVESWPSWHRPKASAHHGDGRC